MLHKPIAGICNRRGQSGYGALLLVALVGVFGRTAFESLGTSMHQSIDGDVDGRAVKNDTLQLEGLAQAGASSIAKAVGTAADVGGDAAKKTKVRRSAELTEAINRDVDVLRDREVTSDDELFARLDEWLQSKPTLKETGRLSTFVALVRMDRGESLSLIHI